MEDYGRYELLSEIARGAYGIVYRAHDRDLDRIVALKALRQADAGPLARERFLREARLAARLDHPNIVKVFETGEHEGRPFYTMAFLEGAPLRGPLPPVEVCRLMIRVADAVAHAHARSVIHRDLKPANILVCDGEPVLTDFGVARGMADLRVTESGELLGTPAYMAPEQIRGEVREADGKADVHALGVILHEMLSGRLPFAGETFVALSAEIQNDPAPVLTGFDPGLVALVRRCLEKDPAHRPSAAELAKGLERWVPHRRARWAVSLSFLAALTGTALWAGAAPSEDLIEEGRVRIPAGVYEIGDPRIDRRKAVLEEFWIDLREVPARAGGYSYLDGLAFCLKQGRRLPTEEEWEAATGGQLFPWGEAPDPSRTACEGTRGPNPRDLSPFGCRDLAGNLAEWTSTPGRTNPATRVVRGGHWQSPIEQCTSYARQEVAVTKRAPTLGFRCASSLPPAAGH
jgi:tRNA A-37 threonylcarbamoyl transferase component Bud32